MRVFTWALAAYIVFSSTPAFAQGERPSIELGVGITAVAGSSLFDTVAPSEPPVPNFRVTVPFSRRFSIEGSMSPVRASQPRHWEFSYYTIQLKQRLVRNTRRGFHPFITYGVAGVYSFHATGPPAMTMIGGGVQQQLGSHVAVRAEAQMLAAVVIPVGARFTTDISIPIGRYR